MHSTTTEASECRAYLSLAFHQSLSIYLSLFSFNILQVLSTIYVLLLSIILLCLTIRRLIYMASLSSNEGSTSSTDRKLQEWSIPKIKTKQVYKTETSFFKFKPDYVIHRVENDISVQSSCMDLVIMDSNMIDAAKRSGSYLHLGLIQVAVKPLTRLRLDTRVLICLRDRRLTKFHPSLLAVLESNLQSGPAYFNFFPSYSISLSDAWAKNFLVLDIKIPSDKFVEGTFPISVMYRFCFKSMNSFYGSRALRQSPRRRETEIIEARAQSSSKKTRRILKHDQIEFPEEWLQERPTPKHRDH